LPGDFNIPNYDWKHGLSTNNCHYYSKQEGDAIKASACVLGPGQRNAAEIGRNLLDLIFSNFDIIDIMNADYGMVTLIIMTHPWSLTCCYQTVCCYRIQARLE
jgi:hypothetical protein